MDTNKLPSPGHLNMRAGINASTRRHRVPAAEKEAPVDEKSACKCRCSDHGNGPSNKAVSLVIGAVLQTIIRFVVNLVTE